MMDSKENQPECHDSDINRQPLLGHKLQVKSQQKQTIQHKPNTQQFQKQSYQCLSQLVFQYKLSLEYSPALGIYILPEENDFYSKLLLIAIDWHFYLFLREGYYKDAKLKGIIRFDKQHEGIKIVDAAFFTTVFHPLVQFNTGKIDLSKLLQAKSHQNINECFTLLLKLKEMFIKEHYFSIKDSFNQQAAKIYQKNEVLFIEKVFETTVIPYESCLNENFQKLEGEIQSQETLSNEDEEIELLRMKIKQLCPNSTLLNIEQKLLNSQPDSPLTIDSKVSRLLEIILSQ